MMIANQLIVATAGVENTLQHPPSTLVLDQLLSVLYPKQLVSTQTNLFDVNFRVSQTPSCLYTNVSTPSHHFGCL